MTPQPGILEAPLAARYYLEYRVESVDGLAERVASIEALSATRLLFGFGPTVARHWYPEVAVTPFESIEGPAHAAPATQSDLFVAVQGEHHDDVFDQVLAVQQALGPVAEVALELRGFDFHASRDLIGFEDGTGNPKAEKAVAAAVIADDWPGAGGSFAMTQRWQHDLPAFAALPVAEQEQVIGRTKQDSIEFEGDAMPADSHVSRTDVSSAKILRRSSPYGDATAHGLYFVAFACAQDRFRVQLERMYGISGDGLADRLLDYSRARTGSYWFVPSRQDLSRVLAPDSRSD